MELIGGEVASMGLAGYPHEVTKRNLFIILAFWLHQRPIGAAFCETGFPSHVRDYFATWTSTNMRRASSSNPGAQAMQLPA
jgi:hypothetical protein